MEEICEPSPARNTDRKFILSPETLESRLNLSTLGAAAALAASVLQPVQIVGALRATL